jgi:hypothetical protein
MFGPFDTLRAIPCGTLRASPFDGLRAGRCRVGSVGNVAKPEAHAVTE